MKKRQRSWKNARFVSNRLENRRAAKRPNYNGERGFSEEKGTIKARRSVLPRGATLCNENGCGLVGNTTFKVETKLHAACRTATRKRNACSRDRTTRKMEMFAVYPLRGTVHRIKRTHNWINVTILAWLASWRVTQRWPGLFLQWGQIDRDRVFPSEGFESSSSSK